MAPRMSPRCRVRRCKGCADGKGYQDGTNKGSERMRSSSLESCKAGC